MKLAFNAVFPHAKKTKREILKTVSAVIDSGVFLRGQKNQLLQKNLQKFLGGGYVVPTASGHDSILLGLQSLRLSADDEVIIPANAYPAAFPAAQSGAHLVLADVDKNGLIAAHDIARKITSHTRAILIVHLYGLVCDIDVVKKIIRGKNIVLIEDCAQAFGSTYKGKPVGARGDIGCFSFYPTKNLGTLGDGGALWVKQQSRYRYLTKAVSYGETRRYKSEFVSGHSRIPEVQAAIVNLFLRDSFEEFEKRRRVLQIYQECFVKYNLTSKIRLLYTDNNSTPVLHLLVAALQERDKLRAFLTKNSVETHVHYPSPIHMLPAFSYLQYKKGDFPIAEKLSKTVLSLPFHQYLSKRQIDHIGKLLYKFFYGKKTA